MFVWKERQNFRDEMLKIVDLESDRLGSNRRAIGLVPFPTEGAGREVVESANFRYQKVLVALEGKGSTCCLKVTSPKRRSRGAVLVFRGRVLGSIYGRKDLAQTILGADAYEQFVGDLSDPESIVDTYILPETIVLAASSLFHGSVYTQPDDISPMEAFDKVYNDLKACELPGCIVAKRCGTEDLLCLVYMFGGEIVGVFTFTEGWLDESYESARDLFVSQAISVSAGRLDATNVRQVRQLTFSLSGL